MLVLLPAICCFYYRKKIFYNNQKLQQLSIAFIVLFLAANFMTLSFKTYLPLCPDSRHFLFLIPFATVLSSFMLHNYFKQPKEFYVLPILFLMADIRLFYCSLGHTKTVYFLLTLILLIAYLAQHFNVAKKQAAMFIILFVFIFSIKGLSTFINEPYPFYFNQKKLVNNLLQQNTKATVYCNSLETQETCEFITKFKEQDIVFEALTNETFDKILPNNKLYFLINESFESFKTKEFHQKLLNQVNNKIEFIKQGNVYLYSITSKETLYTILNITNQINSTSIHQ